MIRYYQQIEILLVLGLVIVISLFILFRIFSSLNNIAGEYIDPKHKVENSGKHVLLYFLTYVIPFLTVDIFDWQDLATYAVIFFVIGIIYIKSDLIYLNPTLALLKYKIYKVTVNDKEIVVITRNNNDLISNPIVKIGTEVYFERD